LDRESLVVSYLPVAYRLAHRFPRNEREDARQVASEALTRAADRWDQDRPFERFASSVIVHALADYASLAWHREVPTEPLPETAVEFEDEYIEREMVVLRRVILDDVRRALPPELRAGLDAFMSGSVAEYARRSSVPERTMRDRWHRAAAIARTRLLVEDAA
jgi:RNA polymerase sigma factor (sigma-70 family)